MKVNQAILRDNTKVKAIRVYIPELMKEVDSSVERNEHPELLIKKTFSEPRNCNEIELVFKGERHIEDLSYFSKPPSQWTTFGLIVLTPEQAKSMAEKILGMVGEKSL